MRRNFSWAEVLTSQIYAYISVFGPFDLVRQDLQVPFNLRGIILSTNQSLYAKDCILGIGNGLPLGNLPHQSLPFLRDGHDGRRRAPALGICNDFCLAPYHDSNA